MAETGIISTRPNVLVAIHQWKLYWRLFDTIRSWLWGHPLPHSLFTGLLVANKWTNPDQDLTNFSKAGPMRQTGKLVHTQDWAKWVVGLRSHSQKPWTIHAQPEGLGTEEICKIGMFKMDRYYDFMLKKASGKESWGVTIKHKNPCLKVGSRLISISISTRQFVCYACLRCL